MAVLCESGNEPPDSLKAKTPVGPSRCCLTNITSAGLARHLNPDLTPEVLCHQHNICRIGWTLKPRPDPRGDISPTQHLPDWLDT
ncbi:hypothetical protein ANN_01803 [Periplaneta americana]|uniref:Uncharacterized protein n=1 Tax=Periplaneta americana TaxID=6978 RepID=A0ABQ8TWB8_PERAM|nr:hypothetical protein ANN_01803 [Periplaneta americana]